MKINVVLVEPEIPQNTGNIARTCAATGGKLHLVHPLGFSITEKAVKRAGLDYWDKLEIEEHDSFEKFLARHEGYKSFFWRPPGINRKIRVVCRTWSATEHITYTDFSCQFDEVVI